VHNLEFEPLRSIYINNVIYVYERLKYIFFKKIRKKIMIRQDTIELLRLCTVQGGKKDESTIFDESARSLSLLRPFGFRIVIASFR